MLAHWVQAPIAKALGWTLIHFVWEGLLIAAVFAGILALCGTVSARLRYGLACLAMAAMPVAFGITLARLWPNYPDVVPLVRNAAPGRGAAIPLVASQVPLLPGQPRLENRVPWIVPFWMLGVFIFHARALGGWLAAQRLRRVGVCLAPDAWQHRLQGLGERLRLMRPVTLWESCLGEVPVIVGFLRPMVLVPVGMLAGLPVEQVESILIHELAHIRRHDYLVNLLQSFLEGLFFYHPAMWWISGVIREERENCCDDVVVAMNGDARGYAAALASLEQNRWPTREPALAATGGRLMKRIRRILQPQVRQRTSPAPVFLAGILLVTAVVALSAWQTKSMPSSRVPERKVIAPVLAEPQTAPPNPAAQSQNDTRQALNKLRGITIQHRLMQLAQAVQQSRSPQQVETPSPDAQNVKPLTDKQLAQREGRLQRLDDTPYRKWLTEDVAYIITNEERDAFKHLETNQDRERFIEQFWLRRDPTPGTVENEMKEEHYRRIAFAYENYSVNGLPGWKTDRGLIYISYGPPDEKAPHTSRQTGDAVTGRREQWRYRYIEGIGRDIKIDFVDPNMTGEFRMALDPKEAEILLAKGTPDGAFITERRFTLNRTQAGLVTFVVPIDIVSDQGPFHLYGTITTKDGRAVTTFDEDGVTGSVFRKSVPLAPGSYYAEVTLRANGIIAMILNKAFEVK